MSPAMAVAHSGVSLSYGETLPAWCAWKSTVASRSVRTSRSGAGGGAPGPVVVGGVEPVHLPVGEDVVARAQGEVVGCRAAQGVRSAELGVGPGVGKGVGGAVVSPAQRLGEVVRGERAASVGERVEDGGRVRVGAGVLGWVLGVGVAGQLVDGLGVRGEVGGVQVQAAGEFEDDVQGLVGQRVHGDGALVDAEEVGELPRGEARVVQAAAQFVAPAAGLVARGRVEAVGHRSGPSSERITTSRRRASIQSVRGAGPAPIPATSHMPRWSQNGLTPIRRQVRPMVSTRARSEASRVGFLGSAK